MRAEVIAKETIVAKPADVFKYLQHLKYHYLWNPTLRELSAVKPLKLGATYKTTSMVLGVEVKANNEVTKFVPAEELEISNSTGILKYKVSYKLKTNSPQTVITCKTSVSSDTRAFAFAQPVLKMLAKRELQSDLEALKIAVENQIEP